MALGSPNVLAARAPDKLHDLPPFGNVRLMHFTDRHAQLLPVYFREPSVNIGVGEAFGRIPHLVGDKLLKQSGVLPGTPEANAFACLDFEQAPKIYGKVGGFAHLSTMIKRIKASRPGALLLDGGDTRFCDRIVDQLPGHGRCLPRAGCRRHDGALGNDAGRPRRCRTARP